MYDVRCKRADVCRLSCFCARLCRFYKAQRLKEHELNELTRIMEGKPKRVRFRKDGKLDIEFETEDGRTEIAEGCTLHIETDPNSGDEFPVTFTVHKGEQYLIKDTN